MILKLDPRWPLVWRDPVTLQVGIDPPRLFLEQLTALDERLVAALAVGVPRNGLDVLADGRTDRVDALLERLEGLLIDAADGPAVPRIAVTGVGALADSISAVLGSLGHHVERSADPASLTLTDPDIAIAVGAWVLPPQLHSYWLRRDTVHMPVVMTDTAVHVGPVIEPGDGPCLLCLELYHADEDRAWPAIATQLLGRGAAAGHPALLADAAATVARLASRRLDVGPAAAVSVRIGADGERTERLWEPHPDCGCRGIAGVIMPTEAPRGIDSPDAASAPVRRLPTTSTGGAALA